MKLKQLLRSMRQSLKSSRRPAQRPTKRRRPLRLEALEDRVVPSLLFKPIFGSEDPTTMPGDSLQSPHAYFTFWGSYWNTPAGTQYENALINISQKYLSSSILQGDKQYGGDGLAYYGTSWIDSSDPPANFNSLSGQTQFNDIQATIQGAIDNQSSPIPAPSHVATTPVYLVVLPPTPGLASSAGWNNIGTYTSGGSSTPIHMALLTTLPSDTTDYSILLSHEFEESVNSDVVITHPQNLPFNLNGDFQICDNETNGVYSYLLPTGAWAQAYWSHQDGKYIIPEGNSQSLQLSALWNVDPQTAKATFTGQYDLTINGSQGLAANDTVTIAASGTTVSVTLNGENWQFPNDPLHSITISNLQGNATVNIEDTAGTPVTVNLGTGTDTVNITPTSQNLDNLLANVQVNGGAGYDTLNVFDSTNTFNDTYTMTTASITRNNAPTVSYSAINAVNIYGGNGTEIYTVNNTAAFFTTTIHGGATANTVNVLGTTGTLNVVGGSSSDVVNVGNSGSVQAIFGDIHVTNPFFYSALNVDDSADTTGRTVTITNASITGLAPAGIYYAQTDLKSLNIKAGSGGSTFSVQSTPNNPAFNPVPTSLSSRGIDTVIVGNAGSVQGIQGSLTIDNSPAFDTILVDDSADGTPRTATLSTFTPAGDTNFGEISGLAPGTINYEHLDTTSLTVKTGNVAGNVVNVLATGTLTNLVGNASTTVTVGSGGSVQSIFGTLNIENPSSFTAIMIDDSSDVTARKVVLSSVGPNASDSQANSDPWDQISGLAPANINYEEFDTTTVTINTGKTAGNVVGFLATDSIAVTTLNANAATTINVGNAGNAQSIAGTLTLNGPANSLTVKVDDSADASGRVTTLAAGSLTGLTPGAINFTASMMKSLTVNAGGGNDALTVSAAPTFTTTVDLRGGNNTLTGPNTSNTWMITGANHGTLDSKLTFSNAENLVGGTGNDTFKFSGATPSIAGTVTGGGGADKLDYSLYTGGPISVNLATNAISLVNGGAAGGFIGTLASVAGNTNAGNKLTGANSLNNWDITAKNGGKVNTLAFTKMPNLVGGSGIDIFKFGNSLLDTVATIDGGGGGDWLDYSVFAAAVAVNLVANTATNVTGSIHNIQNVHGGNSTTTLTGDSQGNILIGGSAGGGAITGGSGRSLLIADKGGAAVTGGSSAGDILIADSTTFDSDSNAHLQALMSILAEWQSADSLATRFHDINTGTGGGLNGTNMLKWGTTVKDNPSPDAALTVTAASASGLDWFFVDSNDTAVNFLGGDHKDNT